jgi:phospholipid/cholesterol/gamma-HCH transport system substrate-binding protein
MVESVHNADKFITSNEAAVKETLQSIEAASETLKSKSATIDAAIDQAEDVFKGFDKIVTRIDNAIPGLSDGDADGLLHKVKSIRELAESFKQKSARVMDDGRQTLLDVSDGANGWSSKLEGQPIATPRRGPRRR